MRIPQLYIFPVVTGFLLPLTVVITFTIAVTLKHTVLEWPYISDTGTYPPESGIFSLLMNISLFFLFTTFYIRYRQIFEIVTSLEYPTRLLNYNTAGFYLGILATVGLALIANFQETEVGSVHNAGALIAFGAGSGYICLQTWLSGQMMPLSSSYQVHYVRVTVSFISVLSFLTMTVAGQVANAQFHGIDPTKWKYDDGGWYPHIVSSISEWILAICIEVFLFSLVPEFKKIRLNSPRLDISIDNSNNIVAVDTSYDRYDERSPLLA